MNKFLEFVKKYYGYILLTVILLLICLISFKQGYYLLSNDNYSPELNPLLTIERSIISPAWRSYRVLGFASESEQADIFRATMFWIGDLILHKEIIGQLFYLISLCIGSWFTALLTKRLLIKSKLKKYAQEGFILSGIVYISTLWTAWVFYQSMGPYITNFGFLPLLLYSIYIYLEKSTSKNALILFVSSILFTSTCVIATLFVSDLILIFSFTIFFAYIFGKTSKVIIRKILPVLIIFFVTQLFWILPFIHYTLISSQDIIGSYTNRTITSSVIDLETQMQTAINSLRLYSRILTDSNGKDFLFPVASDFTNYDFYKVVGLFPAIFSVLGTIFGIFKKNWKLIFFFVLAFGVWFLIKVTNPPLGSVFTLFQEYVPLFKQVFRWPSSKLTQIFVICLSILSTFGVIYFINFISSFFENKKFKSILFLLVTFFYISLQFVYAGYIFNQQLFPKDALVKLPEQYYNLANYLEKNDPSGRIYYAPPANNNYFREYDWGFRGSQFISYIVPNPMMDMSSAVGSHLGEKAMLEIYDIFKAGKSDEFLNLMHKYNSKYILVDRSLVSDGFTYDIDWDLSELIWKDYDKIWEEDFLTLYEVPNEKENLLLETLDRTNNSFKRSKSTEPSILPLNIDFDEIQLVGNSIVGSFVYQGNDTVVSNNFLNYQENYPSKIFLKNKQLFVEPSLPHILTSDKGTLTKKTLNIENYDYYVVDNLVLTKSQLENGITVSKKFENFSNISAIKKSSFEKLNLTNTLSKSSGTDCSNGGSLYSVAVKEQGNALGLSLESQSELPCVFSKISLSNSQDYIAKLKINWEVESNIYPGYCLYSEKEDRCLNDEKFIYTKEPFGEIEILVPETLSRDSKYSLILYALNQNGSKNVEITFRDILLEIAPVTNLFSFESENISKENHTVMLKNGSKYQVEIPVVYSQDSYVYNHLQKKNIIWQPSVTNSRENTYEIFWNEGMVQRVEREFLNQSNNLFSTEPGKEYLVFWKGENISNIPANVCFVYSKDEECWYQEMFLDDKVSSFLSKFTSNSEYTNRLDVVLNSTSYSNLTENKLHDFVIMQIPESWKNLKYTSALQTKYTEYEMDTVGNPTYSTMYKISKEDIKYSNVLVSIPQAKANGWLAISTGKGFNILDNDSSVAINGWKQAWDVSNISFDNIYVIYWPNLLAYLGYILIVIEFIYLLIKVLDKKSYERK